jgi:hypothetical protein
MTTIDLLFSDGARGHVVYTSPTDFTSTTEFGPFQDPDTNRFPGVTLTDDSFLTYASRVGDVISIWTGFELQPPLFPARSNYQELRISLRGGGLEWYARPFSANPPLVRTIASMTVDGVPVAPEPVPVPAMGFMAAMLLVVLLAAVAWKLPSWVSEDVEQARLMQSESIKIDDEPHNKPTPLEAFNAELQRAMLILAAVATVIAIAALVCAWRSLT